MEQVLGVAIGVALVCLLLSIIASHVQEVTATFASRRAATLEIAIQKMFDDPQLYSIFLSHPLIQNISFNPPKFLKLKYFSEDKPRPTYIPSALFSRVLLTALTIRHDTVVADYPGLVAVLPESALKTRLQTLMTGILDDANACRVAVEEWYDSTMDRVNGFYKRRTQWILLGLGLLLAVLCNANIFYISTRLWNSQAARDQVSEVAQAYSCSGSDCEALRQDYSRARKAIDEDLRALPLGYDLPAVKNYWRTFNVLDVAHNETRSRHNLELLAHWSVNLFGWLLMAIAVSLGAPFWFDVLNKFVNLRLAGAKPPKVGEGPN
ncbi:MAG TPA: hypothetical protein VHT24_10780 [Pseudacidobacterium sp.]|jgi:hypothetical protein|nr:hypothetical protein [Pseudacidobacterium sp.]